MNSKKIILMCTILVVLSSLVQVVVSENFSNSSVAFLSVESGSDDLSFVSTTLNLVLSGLSWFVGDNIALRGEFRYENKSPVLESEIFFYANKSLIGLNQTDSEGVVEILWNTSEVVPGIYVLNANFSGTEQLLESSDEVIVELIASEEPDDLDVSELNLNSTTPAENVPNSTEIIISTTKHTNTSDLDYKLAETVNGESIYSRYGLEYLGWYNNFTDERRNREVLHSDTMDLTLKVGFNSDSIKPIEIDGDIFVIHLIACNQEKKWCSFRINGVPTRGLYGEDSVAVDVRGFREETDTPTKFLLAGDYYFKLKSIEFGYCDNRRFCNRYYDAYDKVEIEIAKIR